MFDSLLVTCTLTEEFPGLRNLTIDLKEIEAAYAFAFLSHEILDALVALGSLWPAISVIEISVAFIFEDAGKETYKVNAFPSLPFA